MSKSFQANNNFGWYDDGFDDDDKNYIFIRYAIRDLQDQISISETQKNARISQHNFRTRIVHNR